MRPFLLAIDGPAGAGKSTASRRAAAALGFAMVDTGAIYRTVALAALRAGIPLDDDGALGRLLPGIRIAFRPGAVLLDGADVSREIRTPEISRGASVVSARPVVREALLDLQRQLALAAPAGAVLEGRDIGTVVFPEADLKIFLTASAETRARRRYEELRARGEAITFEAVLAAQEQRDRDDTERAIAPLRAARDAVELDTSGLTLDQVVERIVSLARERMAARRVPVSPEAEGGEGGPG